MAPLRTRRCVPLESGHVFRNNSGGARERRIPPLQKRGVAIPVLVLKVGPHHLLEPSNLRTAGERIVQSAKTRMGPKSQQVRCQRLPRRPCSNMFLLSPLVLVKTGLTLPQLQAGDGLLAKLFGYTITPPLRPAETTVLRLALASRGLWLRCGRAWCRSSRRRC